MFYAQNAHVILFLICTLVCTSIIILTQYDFFPKGCDRFTENFLRKLGVKLPPGDDTPKDPYTEYRNKVELIAELQKYMCTCMLFNITLVYSIAISCALTF